MQLALLASTAGGRPRYHAGLNRTGRKQRPVNQEAIITDLLERLREQLRSAVPSQAMDAAMEQARRALHQGLAEFRYRLSSAVSLSASFQRTQRTSTVATKDFNDTIYSLGSSYRF